MACECIDAVNVKLAEHNTALTIPLIGPQRLLIETYKLDTKKRGRPVHMFANFCPFCGLGYEREGQS